MGKCLLLVADPRVFCTVTACFVLVGEHGCGAGRQGGGDRRESWKITCAEIVY
jgi:hypothetical protein